MLPSYSAVPPPFNHCLGYLPCSVEDLPCWEIYGTCPRHEVQVWCSKTGGFILHWHSATRGFFAIYFLNPCFQVLLAWDKQRGVLSTASATKAKEKMAIF